MHQQLAALLRLLRQALAHMGWRQHQSGEGTQIGQVHGNVTIHYQLPSAPARATAQTLNAPELGKVVRMYKRALTRTERKGVRAFMVREFDTPIITELSDDDRRRLWLYMQTCIRNRASGQGIAPRRRG